MPTLLEVQNAISTAILLGGDDRAVSLVTPAAVPASDRLNIYRNTFLATLTTALRLSYPAVQNLVGEAFFEASARHFIDALPPKSAYLNKYGEAFADFLAQFPPAQLLPYLPDVARLEWAVNSALHAPDAEPLDQARLSALADLPPERLILTPHPSVTLLRPHFPADVIWRAVLTNDADAMDATDLSDDPAWLLVARGANGVDVSRHCHAEGQLFAALCAGHTFAEAITQAEGADVTLVLASGFARGLFVDFSIKPEILP